MAIAFSSSLKRPKIIFVDNRKSGEHSRTNELGSQALFFGGRGEVLDEILKFYSFRDFSPVIIYPLTLPENPFD